MKRKFKSNRNVKNINRNKNSNVTKTSGNREHNKNALHKIHKKFTYIKELTLADFSKETEIPLIDIIKFFFNKNKLLQVNSILSFDDVEVICHEMNIKLEDASANAKLEQFQNDLLDQKLITQSDGSSQLQRRAPIITVMGHVDHGKTTLLDQIKKTTSLVESEFGGITQHLGAYTVNWHDKKITFIDTPGHSAFTNMREQGVQVTDITVLVVAADDGVQAQTVEAINYTKAANIPIIVAINKIDTPGANPDRVKDELFEHNLIPEEQGGSTIFVEISAKNDTNIDLLMENILLLGDVLELKANPNELASGVVLESHLNKKIGNFATLIVQNGTLKENDLVIFDDVISKYKSFTDELKNPITSAAPSSVCVVGGIKNRPSSGTIFKVFPDLKAAKKHIKSLASEDTYTKRASFSNLVSTSNNEKHDSKYINVIIKTDVSGTAVALANHLQDLSSKEKALNILHYSATQFSEDDLSLAAISNAIIIAFNVGTSSHINKLVQEKNIDVLFCNTIYQAEDYLKKILNKSNKLTFIEEITGVAEVREIFPLLKNNSIIAGCRMKEGYIDISFPIKYYRDDKLLFEGHVKSLRHLKNNIKRTTPLQEFGIIFQNFNDIKQLDVVKGFSKKIQKNKE